MNTERGLPHRPLMPEELEGRAAEIDRDRPEDASQVGVYVAGARAPEATTTVHPAGDGWRVELDIHGGIPAHQPGQTVEPITRPGTIGQERRQLDGFLPEAAPVRSRPDTEVIAAPAIRLRGRKGEYTPYQVFPGDTRKLLTDHSWPWNLTGLVLTSDGTGGSGVLVGDRLMLTAHHMRPDNSIAKGSWWMSFAPNFDSGIAPFGTSFVSDLRHYDTDTDLGYIVGHDFMLCRLYTSLGHHLGYLGASSFDDSWRGWKVWQNIGYPVDVGGGQRPAVQFNQSMEDDYEDDGAQYLETEASLNHGNSGGPFFSWFTDNNVRLCGVVSGGLTFAGERDNALAGGDDAVNLIDWGRSNWPL